MGRRSAEATKARLIWPSLRAAAVFFVAGEVAAFFALGEETFLLDVWPEKPACNDTRSTHKENKKRLTSTDFNFAESRRP